MSKVREKPFEEVRKPTDPLPGTEVEPQRAVPRHDVKLTEGRELPSPMPVAPPIGYKRQESMFDIVRRMISEERVRQAFMQDGLETPEEADDFDVDDDFEPSSPYEHNFDPPLDPPAPPSAEQPPKDKGTADPAPVTPPKAAGE